MCLIKRREEIEKDRLGFKKQGILKQKKRGEENFQNDSKRMIQESCIVGLEKNKYVLKN